MTSHLPDAFSKRVVDLDFLLRRYLLSLFLGCQINLFSILARILAALGLSPM